MGTIDNGWQIAAAALISGAVVLMFNALPIIVGALARDLELTSDRIGILVSAYFAGHFLMTVVTPLWFRKADWRVATGLATVFGSVVFIAIANTGEYPLLLGLLALAGACGGTAYVIAMTTIAESSSPARNFGYAFGSQIGIGMLMVFLLPTLVIAKWGFSGVAFVLAGVFLLGTALAMLLPSQHQPAVSSTDKNPASRPRILLIGYAIFFAGASGMWAFFERIGASVNLDAQYVGTILALSLAAAGGASALTVILNDRLGYRGPVISGIVLVLGSLSFLSLGINPVTFAIAAILFQGSWALVINYMSGAVAASDKSGNYTPLIPAALGVGSVAGPLIAGQLLTTGLYALIGFTVLTAVTGALIYYRSAPSRAELVNE